MTVQPSASVLLGHTGLYWVKLGLSHNYILIMGVMLGYGYSWVVVIIRLYRVLIIHIVDLGSLQSHPCPRVVMGGTGSRWAMLGLVLSIR